ncbi:MAG TPA: ATP-binding cassette domain-containing protein [Candidatus Aphodoplasma excrementigallinarum]|uniref:ATP-binding cassette domain-containing protein n=1 Tax=Candidatus Aphodoplasma excrementigallinarum TaxID=2840673 RepID=A0A9D1NGH2_9FIRM|nr:ATP-binding cassette domain-containing protein [Candidatus Aphodoplasma excrementigallinarum]
MLKLENICWTAPDGKRVLNGLSDTIPDGKLVAITGPNGSGKTTLARLIAGIEQPSAGRILLDGEDITSLDVTERARRGISFAFQQPVRFKGLTVRQLIEIAAGNNMKTDRLCDILSSVGLCANEYLNREVNDTLSGGEIKRIEIATVIARHTKLTVFDEPEAGIDLWSFANLIQVFQRLRETLSGTLIIISHQERILRIADEIMLLDGGRIRASGPADEMLGNVLKADSAMRACHKQEAVFNE